MMVRPARPTALGKHFHQPLLMKWKHLVRGYIPNQEPQKDLQTLPEL